MHQDALEQRIITLSNLVDLSSIIVEPDFPLLLGQRRWKRRKITLLAVKATYPKHTPGRRVADSNSNQPTQSQY